MAIDQDVIDEAVARYARERDRYLKLAARVADVCRTRIVEDNAIRAQVTSRTKTVRSFEGKLRRFAKRADKRFDAVTEVFDGIGDFAGVRIAAYRPEDERRIVEEIRAAFCGPDGGPVAVEAKDKLDPALCKFYRSTHCQVHLPQDQLVGDYENLRGASCEVQVCSMMSHVWNEIEHDIGYKPEAGESTDQEKGLLEALGHLTRSGDATITRLLAANEGRLKQQTGDFVDVHDFVARLRNEFPTLELSVNAGVAYELSQLLGMTNPHRVREAASTVGSGAGGASERLHSFNAFLQNLGSTELQLNARSADMLTIALLDRYPEAVFRSIEARGPGRPSRAVGLARRYRDYLASDAEVGCNQVASPGETRPGGGPADACG